jgi:hypothetical protein
MSLTLAERSAAQVFRYTQRLWLAKLPPADITVSVFVRNYRHECAARDGKSIYLTLREHYAWSPAYHACGCGEVCCPALQHESRLTECDNCGPVPVMAAKRFGWIWLQGQCSACGVTARSKTGRLVDPAVRPPSGHAVIS